VIWKTEDDKGYNEVYDADCIVTLAKTLRTCLNNIGSEDKHLVIRYNNKAFMQAVCNRLGIKNITDVFGVLDKYYKMDEDMFTEKLSALLTPTQLEEFSKIRQIEKNIKQFPEREIYMTSFVNNIKSHLPTLQ
jgi:hypothetical protein